MEKSSVLPIRRQRVNKATRRTRLYHGGTMSVLRNRLKLERLSSRQMIFAYTRVRNGRNVMIRRKVTYFYVWQLAAASR